MSDRPVRLVILDRDGVINEDSDAFVKSVDEWRPLPGSIDAIARLTHAGITVAVATNQSGLARGLFDCAELDRMHDKLRGLVTSAGGRVDRIAVCPHGPDDDCDCRKPKPGLLLELGEHFGVPLAGVPVIGDARRDLEAALAVDARPILVRTGKGIATEASLDGPLSNIDVFDNLSAAVDALLTGP